MSEPKQPKDYVEDAGIGDHIGKAVEHLSRPTSVLLFLFLIVLVLVGGDWMIMHYRTELLRNWLVEIEDNRHMELNSCQSVMKDLMNACLDKGKSQ